MKITTRQIRQIIKEELHTILREEGSEKYGIGAITQYDGSHLMSITLIDLDIFAKQLESMNPEEFMKNLQWAARNETSIAARDETVVGYAEAASSEKFVHGLAGTGGLCSGTWWISRMVGEGYGDRLFSGIFGLATKNNIYLTLDRNSVTPAAFKWWEKRVVNLSDSVPEEEEPYKGSFDDWVNQTTEPKDDDCKIHPKHPLANKGYMGTQKEKTELLNMEKNLDSFFKEIVIKQLDDPGFFAKLFGSTKQSKAEKFKDKLSRMGDQKFRQWWGTNKLGIK